MKKTIAILLLLALLLCGCGRSVFAVKEHHGKRFEVVAKYDDCDILVDIETGVEYAVKHSGYCDGISVLLDGYGNPLLWEGFDAREDRVTTP